MNFFVYLNLLLLLCWFFFLFYSDEGDEIVECDNCGIIVYEGKYRNYVFYYDVYSFWFLVKEVIGLK